MLYPEDKKIHCLYKYRNLYDEKTGELNPYTMKILNDQIIHFSRPSAFNDPFDVYIPIDFHCTEQEYYKYHFKLKNSTREMRAMIRDVGLSEMVKHMNNISTEDKNMMLQKRVDMFKIFCLSRLDNNILLWSHYSDCHKGVCIGFEVRPSEEMQSLMLRLIDFTSSDNREFEHPLVHINYQDAGIELPVFKHFTDDIDEMSKYFHMKSADWKYEEEMRILLWDSFIAAVDFKLPAKTIKEVIFGLKTPNSKIREVMSQMQTQNESFNDIKFFQMKSIENQYAIEKTPLVNPC